MRKFSSYGSINTRLHYYAPRKGLIEQALIYLLGEQPDEGGHYVTVWGPRQTGKTWLMQQVVATIKDRDDFEVAIVTLQSAKEEKGAEGVLEVLSISLQDWFERDFPILTSWKALSTLFTADYFEKPVILILDEFDALDEAFINKFVNEFRSIHTKRANQGDKKSGEKRQLLHGLALVGVRAVLGVENVTGSPFNVQRSLHIPNLTFDEVEKMFHWYEQESGQRVEPAVIQRLYHETQGQPGLIGWLGELLTETDNQARDKPLMMAHFEDVYAAAVKVLPNNTILNMINKAGQAPYKPLVLEMFRTDAKITFTYDRPEINYLYLNGVIDWEKVGTDYYLKFASPFIQKRLFNYFASDLFKEMGRLYDPFTDLADTITDDGLNVRNLLRRYEYYLKENGEHIFQGAPRRKTDLRIYEAVYHFNLYLYLVRFLQSYEGRVYPEFPTGNGQIDLFIKYAAQTYGLEVKSFANQREYKKALRQAALYGDQLGLTEMWLVFFVEAVDEENRKRYEVIYEHEKTGVTVYPVFVETGN